MKEKIKITVLGSRRAEFKEEHEYFKKYIDLKYLKFIPRTSNRPTYSIDSSKLIITCDSTLG